MQRLQSKKVQIYGVVLYCVPFSIRKGPDILIEKHGLRLTCNTATPNSEEGQFEPPSGLICACGQDELIRVLQ